MRSPLLLALALAVGTAAGLASAGATAQTARAVRATAEASMVLTGNIDVAADGTVSGLVLDQRDAIAPAIATFVDGTIRRWQFEPFLVDGVASPKHAPMRVRLLGRSRDDGALDVRMVSVDFSEYDGNAIDAVTVDRMTPPRYPEAAFRAGAQGEVTLLVKVSTSEARRWTFRPPTSGEDRDRAFWTLRVPVTFELRERHDAAPGPSYGRWKAYIPGPRQTAPWPTGEDAAQVGSDLLPAGGVYMVDSANRGLRLLTPLSKD